MTDTYADRIGGLIRDARKHRGLTQTQLADVLGTSQSAVHRIEAGNQNLSLEMVNHIAAALDARGWRVRFPFDAGASGGTVANTVVFSRYPLSGSRQFGSGSFDQWATTVDVPVLE